MWRCNEAELNWVRTLILLMEEWIQLLMGTSIRRYLAPMGTAGLERVAVSGNRRLPWPPPRMIARVSWVMVANERCLLFNTFGHTKVLHPPIRSVTPP